MLKVIGLVMCAYVCLRSLELLGAASSRFSDNWASFSVRLAAVFVGLGSALGFVILLLSGSDMIR